MKNIKSGILTIAIALCSVIMLNAQTINGKDAQGQKHGLWKGIYEDSKRPRYEGVFEHGKETGVFNYFDDTKANIIIATRSFSEKGTVAYTTLYDRKKNIVSEGKTVNRLNEGEWKYYHEGSKVPMTIEHYSNGKLHGSKKTFFKSGSIAEESNYTNGLRNGPYKRYTEKGIVLEEALFKDDKYDGIAIFRDSEGLIVSKGPFVAGLKKGMWEFYKNGKLVKKEQQPVVLKMHNSRKKK